MSAYTLRRTWPDDPDRPHDYVFRHDGRDGGRCYLTRVPEGDRWRWTVYGRSAAGLELSLEDAKAAWRKAFEDAAN